MMTFFPFVYLLLIKYWILVGIDQEMTNSLPVDNDFSTVLFSLAVVRDSQKRPTNAMDPPISPVFSISIPEPPDRLYRLR